MKDAKDISSDDLLIQMARNGNQPRKSLDKNSPDFAKSLHKNMDQGLGRKDEYLGVPSKTPFDRDPTYDFKEDGLFRSMNPDDPYFAEASDRSQYADLPIVYTPQQKKPKIINISGRPLKIDFDIRGIEKLIFLPDFSPGKGKLPVGTVAIYDEKTHVVHPEYVGPDIGCGMLFAKFDGPIGNLKYLVNEVAGNLLENKDKLGSLGGGNHFITIYEAKESREASFAPGENFVLIHTGSRKVGKGAYEKGLTGREYLELHAEAMRYARLNREEIRKMMEGVADTSLIKLLDRPHNFVEIENGKVIYRKGAVKLKSGETGLISSSMAGDAAIIRANDSVIELANSMSHATGRKVSRTEAKRNMFFLEGFPQNVYVPYFVSAEGLNEELPANYRSIEETLEKLNPYAKALVTLTPIASIMQ